MFRIFPWLPLLLLLPSATGLILDVPAGTTLDSVEVPPGESLTVIADGDLYLDGTLTTHALSSDGHGPDIVVTVAGDLTLLPGSRLVAASGNAGRDLSGSGLVHAPDGGDGGSIFIQARHVISKGAFLQAGNGGQGGGAVALGAPHAVAVAGSGGHGGIVLLNATLIGHLVQVGGLGGDGGDAEARGGDACAGQDAYVRTQNETVGDAEHAEARGGAGACSQPGEDGAPGGNATAIGGNGGYTDDGPGGNGGNAMAIGGRGADALDLCFETNQAAETSEYVKAGDGGPGGTPYAVGGDGGAGLNGGRGGEAYAESRGGNGGNATMPIQLGAGGANQRAVGGLVKGGDGGLGAIDGGPGGGGVGMGFSGDSGSQCGPLPSQGIPTTPIGVVVLSLLAAALTSRRS